LAILLTAVGTVVSYFIVAGSTAASAAARHRSGTVHEQLADHVTSGRASAVVMTGADIMAAIVLLLAVMAALFMVTTFIRRRATAPVPSN
jgi:hypothetical protein